MEAKQNIAYEIVADFTNTQTCIGGKTFPKGYFTAAVMNYGKEKITELLCAAAPVMEMLRLLHGAYFEEELYDKAGASVGKIYGILSKEEPFCYLFPEEETELLAQVFSEEVKTAFRAYLLAVEKLVTFPDPATAKLSEEEQLALEVGEALHKTVYDLLTRYFYFCHDIANYTTAILNLEKMELRNLKQRNEAGYAKACHNFFSNRENLQALYLLQPYHNAAGFSLSPETRMEMLVVPNPKQEGEMVFARRLHFCRIMDFLVMDFFEGLHAGHALRQCKNCGRYFQMTDGRHQLYCDGIAPNDEKGRSCRTFAARTKRLEREKAGDHPALKLYRTRLNTINKHLQRGKIDAEFANTAKLIAEKCKSKACTNVRYYNERYTSDISQNGIYRAAEERLGRPPIQKET